MLETLTPPIPASTSVLIVGAGPVGLAVAGDLGSRGVTCLLIEQSDGAIVQPKMDMVGVRTMEFCRRWGLLEAVRDAPYPRDFRQDCVWGTSITGYEFGRERFAARGASLSTRVGRARREGDTNKSRRELSPAGIQSRVSTRRAARCPRSLCCSAPRRARVARDHQRRQPCPRQP